MEKQILIIFAGTQGYLDDLEVEQCRSFELALYDFMDTNYSGLLRRIAEKKELDDTLRAEMRAALDAFREQFRARTAGSARAAD